MMKCCHFVKKRNNRGSGLLGPVRRNGSVVGGEDPPHLLRCSPDFSLPAQSLHLRSPIRICCDMHGQYHNLLRISEYVGMLLMQIMLIEESRVSKQYAYYWLTS